VGSTIRDLTYGIRTLWRSPGFAIVAILTIALGIAGNTAIFSAIDEQVLRSLPVSHPQQLVELRPTGEHDSFPIPVFEYLRNHTHGLSGMFASDDGRFTILLNGQSDFVTDRFVSGNFDSVMGFTAVLGRGLTAEDDKPGSPPIAVLGYGYWKTKFGASPTVIGKTILAKEVPLKIVGIYPDLSSHWSANVWLPMALHPALALKDHTTVDISGRVSPGANHAEIAAAMSVAYQQALRIVEGATLSTQKQREISNRKIVLREIGRGGTRNFSTELQILGAAVVFVLLIACANLANLLLARATARKREIAIRVALGATRGQLVRQLLTESLLLSLCGGALGFLFAWWGSETSGVFVGHHLLTLSPNRRLLLFTIALSLFVTILFGLAPAFQATAFGKKDAPNLSTASMFSVSQGRSPLRNLLLVAQIGLSIVCLMGAGLLLRTLTKLHQEDVGFNRDNILVAWIFPTLAGYEGQKETTLYWNLLDKLNATPGVASASLSRLQLLSGHCDLDLVNRGSGNPATSRMKASCNSVGPRFFETMGIPFLLGRDFSRADDAGSQKVAIISESTARDYFPGSNPLGQELAVNDKIFKDRLLVIGVAKDIRGSLREEQSHRSPRAVYVPFAQAPEERRGQAVLEIRTPGNPNDVVASVRQQVESEDKGLPLVGLQTQHDVMEDTLGNDRSLAILTTTFGALALALTAIGLYGSIAYAVARRTREIGIRMALGASRQTVLSRLMREAGALISSGLLLGFASSCVVTRAILSQLYGVSAADPVTFLAVITLMGAVAMGAAYVPARRAMAVDPVVALRNE
jgi:predicted permease